MDRDVSPRVAYWSSSFEPSMEAMASEVALLRKRFPDNALWGVSPAANLRLSRRDGFAFHPKYHWLFRGMAALWQGRYDINHLFGSLGDWFHLRALAARPAVLTLAVHGKVGERALLDKVDQFVVEWPNAAEYLRSFGVSDDRIRLIPPPVNLDRFAPTPRRDRPFTVLFASAPERADWFEGRGILLILEAAARLPQMEFRIPWRPWGNSHRTIVQEIANRGLTNVDVPLERISDMAALYVDADATIFPAVDGKICKPIPNSIVESLASARPVVVSDQLDIAHYLRGTKAGKVISPNGDDLAGALLALEREWDEASAAARDVAVEHFGEQQFLEDYDSLYRGLLA